MASKRELEALIVLAGKIDPSLKKTFQKAQSDAGKTTINLSKLAAKTTKLADNILKTATVFGTAVAGGLVLVGKKGLSLASDLKEVQNVVDTTFGKGADQINQWSKAALDAFGLSELSAKKYTGTLGAMLKSSGLADETVLSMSKNLTGLAGDFSSFYNLDQEEAFNKISAGISGETEPLKQLGINMSVANLEAYALSKGIKTSYKNMDQASQTALRYSYLMSVSKDAQGDFSKTQGEFANQSRLLKTNFEQLSATLMTKVLPTVNKYVTLANDFIKGITQDPAKMKKLEDAIAKVAGSIERFGKLAMQVGDYIIKNWPSIRNLIIGIGVAAAAWKVGTVFYEGFKTAKLLYGAISTLALKFSAASSAYGVYYSWKIKDMAQSLYLQALYAKDAIVIGVRTAATWAMTAATATWSAVTTVATVVGGAFAAVLAFITSPIGLIILGIAALVAGVILLYKNWDKVSSFMVDIWQSYVLPFFMGMAEWFSGIWQGITDGFKAAWEGIVSWFGNLFGGVVSIVKGYLNLYVTILNFIISGLNKIQFKMPDWVPGLGGKEIGVNIPLIPKFAKGGFTNQPSIFGEAGLEAAIPIKYKNPRSLSLLNQTAKAIGADQGGSPGLVINYAPVIYGSNAAELEPILEKHSEDLKGKIEEYFEEKMRLAYD